MGLPSGLANVVLITCLNVDTMSLIVTAGRGLQMWEDFMRGNWPAVACAPSAETTAGTGVPASTGAPARSAPRQAVVKPKQRKLTLGSLFARTIPAPAGALPPIPAPAS